MQLKGETMVELEKLLEEAILKGMRCYEACEVHGKGPLESFIAREVGFVIVERLAVENILTIKIAPKVVYVERMNFSQ